MRDLESHARELLIVQTLGEVPGELHVTPDRDARLAEQSARVSRSDLVRFLELLADGMKAVKDGAEARTRIELALVEAASPQIDPGAKALMARIERLEAMLAGNGTAPPAPAPAGPPASAAPPAPASDARASDPPAPVGQATSSAPAPLADPPAPVTSGHAERAAEPEASAVAVADRSDATPAPPAPPAPAPEGLDGMAAIWPAVRDAVCAENQMVGIAISDARPVELRENELVVAFAHEDRFNQRQAALPEHRAIVESALRGLAGRPLRVQFELRELEPEVHEEAAPPPSEDEIVARFVTAFDAQEIVPDPDEDKEGEA